MTCKECNELYIGETKRMLKTRIDEHFNCANSSVYKHWLEKHETTNIHNTYSFNTIQKNIKFDNQLPYIESLYIKKYSNCLMNGVEGIYISSTLP